MDLYDTHVPERAERVRKLSAPIIAQNFSSEYYNVYTYSHVIRSFNDQIQELHNAMIDRIRDEEKDPAIPSDAWKSPLLTRDTNSGLISLYLDKKAYDPKKKFTGSVGDLEVKARLFFNSNMWGLFGNFPNKHSGNDVFNRVNLTDAAYELVPLDTRGLGGEDVKDRDGTEYFRIQQDFDSTATLWSPADALVFTTSMIPVNAEISRNL